MKKINYFYIIKLPKENYYKYGITNDFERRMKEHSSTLKFIEIISTIYCNDENILKKVEREFHYLMNKSNLSRIFAGQFEIFYSELPYMQIDWIVESIKKYNPTWDINAVNQINLVKFAANINKLVAINKFITPGRKKRHIYEQYYDN